MTSEPKKGLVVPKAKAALNAFQCTLSIFGQTPIPGIRAVTAALLQVVKGIQVRTRSSRVFHSSVLHNDTENLFAH